MKTTTLVPIVLIGILLCLSTVFAAPRDRPKRYKVEPRADGRLEITVTGKAALPDGSQIAVIDLREKLKAAAARECPDGYDLETDNASSIGIAPNGQGLIATQKGLVRCKPPTDASIAH